MGMTTAEAAEYLGLKTRAVVRLINLDILSATKHGRDWDIDPDSVKHYSENRPKRGPRPTKKQD